jgi:hypothetical protein
MVSVSISGLEKAIIEILKRSGEALELMEIYSILKRKGVQTTTESTRKTLERLIYKGIVTKDARGLYRLSQKTLDLFVHPSSEPITISLEEISSDLVIGLELLERVKARGVALRRAGSLDRARTIIIGGSAADESSRPLKPYANWSHGSFVRASARIRIAGIAPLLINVTDGHHKIALERIRFLPEHIEKGGSVEFLMERFKRPFIERPLVMRDLTYDVAQEFARKISEFDLIEFKQEMIDLAIAEAKYKSTSCDLAVAFIDGSILPGHLDPYIFPDSETLARWPPEMAELILKRKERILKKFINIYESVYLSTNIVLVGAIKNSNDRSLQALAGLYHDAPDQVLLMGSMKEGDVIGPFKKHRAERVLLEELRKFKIRYSKEVAIESFYVKRRGDTIPLQLDIVFPESMDRGTRNLFLEIIYYLTEASEKHTRIASEDVYIPTLAPIRIIDEEVSKKAREIEIIAERDLGGKLYSAIKLLEEYLEKYPYPLDLALFVYKQQLGRIEMWRG